MKKLVKGIFIFIFIIFAIFLALFFIFTRNREISYCSSYDKIHTLYFIETKQASFFGPQEVRLELKKSKDLIVSVDSMVYNDGKNLDLNNWSVRWDKNFVDVILKGEEQADEKFRLYFSGKVKKFSKERSNPIIESSKINSSENEVSTDKSFEPKVNDFDISDASRISNSNFALLEADRAGARSLWYLVGIYEDKLKFISKIPDTSPRIKATISNNEIILTCEDIHGNISEYRSLDDGISWQKLGK